MLEQLLTLDKTLFLFINNAFANPVLDLLFINITYLGSTLLLVFIAVLLLLNRQKKPALSLLIGLAINVVLILILKSFIARPRPEIGARIITQSQESSFPSGHAANAFMAAGILGKYFSKFIFAFYILAILVGISRIYAGVHYPLDVLAGLVIGVIVNLAVQKLPVEKWIEKIEKTYSRRK